VYSQKKKKDSPTGYGGAEVDRWRNEKISSSRNTNYDTEEREGLGDLRCSSRKEE